MEKYEQKPIPTFDTKEQRVYLPEHAYDTLTCDTLNAIENLEAFSTPDNEKCDYQGFRIENSAYRHGRFTIESSPTTAKARLSLAGPNNARAIYTLNSKLGEADIWTSELKETDLLLNEDVLRLLDRETSSSIFNKTLSIREPTLNDVHDAIRAYSSDEHTKTTIHQHSLYRINQPYTSHGRNGLPLNASNQLLIKRTTQPKPKGSTSTMEAVLERSDTLDIFDGQIDRTYRFMYSTTGEECIELVTRASSPEARELHDATYGPLPTDQLRRSEEASWAFNEALAALDITRYTLDE